MKIHIQQHDLNAVLERARRICGGQLPVTSNVLFVAERDTLTLLSNNLQESLTESVPATIEMPGRLGLPARKLATIVATLPAGLVTIEGDARHSAAITAGASRIKLVGLDASEFPIVHQAAADMTVTSVDLDALQAVLRRCAPAMSDDEARWVICSTLLESVGPEMIRLTASDGRRVVRETLNASNSGNIRTPINRQAVEWLSNFKRKATTVDIEIDEINLTVATVEQPALAFTTRRMEGAYPQVDKVIPATFDSSAVVPRAEFLAALNRVAMLGADSVRLTFEAGEVTLSAKAADVGEASEKLGCQYDGDKYEVAFNPDYLRLPFDSLKCAELFVDLGQGGTEATVVRDGGAYHYALMPMRLS
jgi:DNA polymerase-3 subunit beta